MIAGTQRRPPIAATDAPSRRVPTPALVDRVRSELGIREESRAIEQLPRWRDGYGPTSHFTESMLFHAYRRAADVDEDEL